MKLNHIAAGLVAAFASAGAFAAPNITLPATAAADIYISGATSLNPVLLGYLRKNCSALDYYTNVVSPTVTNHLYNCTVGASAIAGVASGSTLTIHKSSTGSSDGVVAVANQTTALKFLNQADAGTIQAAATEVSVPAATTGTVTLNAYKSYVINVGAPAGGITTQPPQFGFSDVEPKFFSVAAAAKLSATPVFGLIFGVPVTKTLRDALQDLQYPTITAAQRETLAFVPSLTSKDLSGIYSGSITDAGVLGVTGGAIHVARRSDGSGTTKVFDLAFLNNACGSSTPFVSPNSTAANACATVAAGGTQPRVTQHGTSDDVVACLNAHNTGARYGVGVLSMEYNPAVADGYRFIRVDGAVPSLLNTAEGRYSVLGEVRVNEPSPALAASTNNTAAQALAADLKNELSNVNILAAVNASSIQTIGNYRSGLLARPSSTSGAAALAALAYPITSAQLGATPVNLYSHGADSCAPFTSSVGADSPFIPE